MTIASDKVLNQIEKAAEKVKADYKNGVLTITIPLKPEAQPRAVPIAIQVAGNIFILGGLFLYVVSVVVWLLVLSRVEVSFAYPMLSVGYIVNAVAGYYLFQENLSLTRITGILIIIAGVYLVTRS